MLAWAEPKRTALAPPRFSPVMVTVSPPATRPEGGVSDSTVGCSANDTWKPAEPPDAFDAYRAAQYSAPATRPARCTETGWEALSEKPSGVGAPSWAGVPREPSLEHHSEAIGEYRTRYSVASPAGSTSACSVLSAAT